MYSNFCGCRITKERNTSEKITILSTFLYDLLTTFPSEMWNWNREKGRIFKTETILNKSIVYIFHVLRKIVSDWPFSPLHAFIYLKLYEEWLSKNEREKRSTAWQSCFFFGSQDIFFSFKLVFPTLYLRSVQVCFHHILLFLLFSHRVWSLSFFSDILSVSPSVEITRGSNACLHAQANVGRWFKSNTLFRFISTKHTHTLIHIHIIFLSLSLSLSLYLSLSLFTHSYRTM